MKERRERIDEQLLTRVRGEFLEMPGLRLTRDQARRLWGLDDGTCALVLDILTRRGFLLCGSDGRYACLADLSATAPPSGRMAKARIRTGSRGALQSRKGGSR
jgi:hypothetical protein